MKKLFSSLLKRRKPTPRLQGTVRWFSAGQGFGFIEVPGESEPYFAHHSQISEDANRFLRGGQGVDFEPLRSTVGLQARSIRLVS